MSSERVQSRRALYLRGERVREIRGGADRVSQSVLRMLMRYFGGAVEELYLDEVYGGVLRRGDILSAAAKGLFLPYGQKARTVLRGKVSSADFLFVDQSVYGLACGDAKTVNPSLRVAVLFHNVEKKFYLDRVLKKGALHNLLIVPPIARAERSAARYADLVIALSERDRNELRRYYGRSADIIMPAVLEDEFSVELNTNSTDKGDENGGLSMLFVGSAFPPNLDGIRWFAKKVLPKVQGRLTVVGRGFEAYADELGSDKLRVVGSVPSTAEWYRDADCVVSPIFWGGGIKVKTAEAFMHGKIVVGSNEAFVGYDRSAAGAMLANTEREYLACLNSIIGAKERANVRFSEPARNYFLRNLSFDAQYARLSEALDGLFRKDGSKNAQDFRAAASRIGVEGTEK